MPGEVVNRQVNYLKRIIDTVHYCHLRDQWSTHLMQPANRATERQGLRVPPAASVPPREPPHLPNAISCRGVVNTRMTNTVTLTLKKRSLKRAAERIVA